MHIEYIPISSLSAFNFERFTVLAVTLKAYYDGSGKKDTRFITLAGYVGTSAAWNQFEKQWSQILNHHGCQYLHMREARSLRGEFEGWTHKRVDALLADLFNDCLSPIGWEDFKGKFYGASCTVNIADYKRAKAEIPSLKSLESICVDYVITIALRALPENLDLPFGKEGTLELFFDKGESFLNKVDRIWRAKPRNKLEGPLQLVSGIGSLDMHDVIGLQAADFLAWQTNRYHTHSLNEGTGAFAGITRVLAAPMFEYYYDHEKLMGLKI